MRRCLALAAWLGPDGKPVTGSAVLAVAAARTAYEELGLRDLSEPSTPRGSEEQPSLFGTEQEDALARQSPVRLRSAADLPALQQLWQVGVGSGLVEVNKGVARTGSRNCSSDEDWLLLGTDLAMGRLLLDGADELPIYAFALRPKARDERSFVPWLTPRADGSCSRRELTKAWWNWLENPLSRDSTNPTRGRSDRALRAALELLEDLGLCHLDGDEVGGTAWGEEMCSLLTPRAEDVEEIVIEVPLGRPRWS